MQSTEIQKRFIAYRIPWVPTLKVYPNPRYGVIENLKEITGHNSCTTKKNASQVKLWAG